MDPSRRRWLALVAGGASTALAGCSGRGVLGRGPDPEEERDPVPSEPVALRSQYRRTDRENVDVEVRIEVTTPPVGESRVLDLWVDPRGSLSSSRPFDSNVTLHYLDSDGYEEVEPGIWEWDGETSPSRITFGFEIHDDMPGSAAPGVVLNQLHIRGVREMFNPRFEDRETGVVDGLPVEQDVTLAGRSYVDPVGPYAVMGPHERVVVSNGTVEMTFVLAVEDEWRLSPELVFRRMIETLPLLGFDHRYTTLHGWVVSGLPLGGYDTEPDGAAIWAKPASDTYVWVHEYLHFVETGMSFGGDLTWLGEALPEYFGDLVRLYVGDLGFHAFRAKQTFSTEEPVAERSPEGGGLWWYEAGGILAALDAEIRSRSGDTTLAAVFRALDADDGVVTYGLFSDLVADAAGERLDSWLDTNVRQPTSTSIPDDPELFLDRVRYGVPRDAELPYGTIRTETH